MALSSVHQHNPDCDIWVHEYFTPSWFCLPNNQPALTVIRPGDTSRDVLEMICKVNVPWGGWGISAASCASAGTALHWDTSSVLGEKHKLPCSVEARSAAENSLQLELTWRKCRDRQQAGFALPTPTAVHEPGSAFTHWLCLCCCLSQSQPPCAPPVGPR